AHEQDMVIIANDPVYRNALYGSTAMNVGKVYPRHVNRNSSLCEPEQLACYPSGVASIRRQHTTSESGEYPTAHTLDEPGPSSDDSTDTAEDVPEELELLHLPNSDVPMTAENTIFPYLFPHGTGHFIPPPGRQSFVGEFGQYLKNRLSCLFSPFTLVQEYILMMYQILIVMQYTTSQRKFTLTDAYKRRRITHPNESEEKCIRHLIKYKVPGTIDFSPQWWRIKVNQINALTKESGMPDYFLTLTVDNITELKWDEYKQMDDILAELNNLREDRGAYKLKMNNCQAEAAVLFHHRVTNFMNYFILGGMKRLGEITKYTCRYEMQGRQAVHAHILLWSTPESVARYSNQIQRDILLDEGPDGTLQRPDPATNPGKYKLHQIICRKQIHNCNGKCLRRGGCKLHFPHGIHLGDIELDELNNSYDYYCPNYESRNVVEYDPLLLMSWNGHMNLKRVTHSQLSFYVCKYTMKSEPTGKLEVNGEVERQLNMARIDPAVVKVVNAATQSQPVSHVEASLQCLGIPVADMRMKHDGRWIKCPFLYIRTEPQEIRRTMLSCSNGVITPHMDYYENRPDLPEMEHITYPEYFRTYRVLKKRLQGEDLYVGQDKKNRFVYRHKCPQIVHFTNHPPTSLPEGFFYNLLLSTVSFRMEGTLLTEGSYFKKCQALGMVDSDEDLERDVSLKLTQHLQQYYRDYNITKYCILTDVAKLREYYKTGANVKDRDDRTTAFQTDQFPESHLALQCPVPLNEDQQNVFDALCRSNFTGLHVINGGPGTGKTFLINKIIQYCTQELKQRVLVTASTGAAARNLPDGSTLHSALSIGPGYKRSILHSTIRTESKQYAICQSSKVLIIDEAFMLTGNFLQTALAKYASVDPHASRVEDVFTTKAVILVGDPNQLPPICHCKSVRSSSAEDGDHHKSDNQSSIQDLAASVCTSCLTERCHYFQYATQHTMHISERQRQDPEFAEFLQNMLHAPPTQADIERVLGHCVLRPDRDGTLGQDEYDTACNETWIQFMSQPGAISLHAHLKKVAYFNTAALHAQFPRYDIIPVDMVSNYEDIARVDDKAARQKKEWCFSEKFHSLQKIAIGCSVVCTQNFGSLANPVFNGDRGIVTSITRKRDSPSIQTIHVLFHGHDVPVGITRKQEEIKFDGHQFVRKTFPLMLAKAMTIHRCQGASITGTTLMDFRDLFAPGMGYVMLSRKTSREGLKLTALPTPRQLTIVKHLLSDRHGPA
ncbi:ATP-dependent DNA helicase PIF6, partial [Picochlorum sp. SENEW3]